MVTVGVAHGAVISEAGGSGGGVALDVANAIRDYLTRAKGDARLALALSVADAVAESKLMAVAAARALRPASPANAISRFAA
jgi:hypothetical protein